MLHKKSNSPAASSLVQIVARARPWEAGHQSSDTQHAEAGDKDRKCSEISAINCHWSFFARIKKIYLIHQQQL